MPKRLRSKSAEEKPETQKSVCGSKRICGSKWNISKSSWRLYARVESKLKCRKRQGTRGRQAQAASSEWHRRPVLGEGAGGVLLHLVSIPVGQAITKSRRTQAFTVA